MAATLIAHTVAPASFGTTTATTPAINTTGANFIIAACAFEATSPCVPTDSKGNVYTALTTYSLGQTALRFFYCENAVTGLNHVFVLTNGIAGTYPSIAVQAWSGITGTMPFDVQNGGTGGPSTQPVPAGSVTPSQNNELIITAMAANNSHVATVNSGFTRTDFQANVGAGFGIAIAYKVQTTAVAVNPTWTGEGVAIQAAAVATFTVAPTPPPPPPPPPPVPPPQPGTGLPPGLTLDGNTGIISGTPTQAGTFTYTVRVTDADGNTATVTCVIVVAGSHSSSGSHIVCVGNVSGGGSSITDTPYIVRRFSFSHEVLPPDEIFFTPWSDLGYAWDKISRNLVLDIDTGGFPCSISLQADGVTQQTFSVTTTSNDRDRFLATNSNLEGRLWRLTLTPATNPGAKCQLFKAALDYINDVNSVAYLDTYWTDFGWVGWSAIKQAWLMFQGGPISVNFLTDADSNFYTVVLPANTTREMVRFYLPAVSNGVLNKSKIHRIQITGVDGADFRLYAGSLLEVIRFGSDQRMSFNLVNINAEMQLQVAQLNTGMWSLGG